MFQYRKRYEVTCDAYVFAIWISERSFQYRKRYEVTCDNDETDDDAWEEKFQYRKRYEVTCDLESSIVAKNLVEVSIPQAV